MTASSADSEFDVILLGTGLTESITAAALSKAGFKVAHIDTHPYYGADDASLSLDEVIQWAEQQTKESQSDPTPARTTFSSISCSSAHLLDSRRYSISLSPAIIPSVGPHISCLVASGVARYGGFKLLQQISVHTTSGTLRNVPGSKEDVFKNNEISLLDKRRIMRFLMFAASDFEEKPEFQRNKDTPLPSFLQSVFSLNHEMSSVVCYALAFCFSPSDTTHHALTRIRRYLRSHGRYGPSSFIIGQYGGAGEIAQGFCRTAAVHGAVYVLGRTIHTITHNKLSLTNPDVSAEPPLFTVTLNDFPDPLSCRILISSASLAPKNLLHLAEYIPKDSVYDYPVTSLARCVAIIDQPIIFPLASSSRVIVDQDSADSSESASKKTFQSQPVDTAAIIFPPSTLEGGSDSVAATVIIMGEGTMSAPHGKWIVYIMLPVLSTDGQNPSAESLLRPYLDHLLSLMSPSNDINSESHLLFKLFYIEHTAPHPSPSPSSASRALTSASPHPLLITPPRIQHPTEFFDSAASNAEATFWRAVETLKDACHSTNRFPETDDGEYSRDSSDVVDVFWPPLDRDGEDNNEDW